MPSIIRIILIFLGGTAVFAGLPITAWGWGDITGFAADPARIGYLAIVVILQLYGAYSIPPTRGEGKISIRRQHLAIPLLQVFSISVVLAGPYCDRRGILLMWDWEVLRWTGLVLHALGFMIIQRATAVLGAQFSIEVTIQEGHRLVTGGLYHHIRHPRYLGIILLMLGISLVFRSWLAFVFVGAVKLILLWRIGDEERLLRKEFGPEWDVYAKRTWRLVPYIY